MLFGTALASNASRDGGSTRSEVVRSATICRMLSPDQEPLGTDVILHLSVPCSGGAPADISAGQRDGAMRAKEHHSRTWEPINATPGAHGDGARETRGTRPMILNARDGV